MESKSVSSVEILEDSEDEKEPIWPVPGVDEVIDKYSMVMSNHKKFTQQLYGSIGPIDREMVQQVHHTIRIAKDLIPKPEHRPTLNTLCMLYLGASHAKDRVKILLCNMHLTPLSQPYVNASKADPKPHRFCYKEASAEWPAACCKIG